MTQTVRELERLMQVTEAGYAAEQAKMGALRQTEFTVRAQIAALRDQLGSSSGPIEDNPALSVGADLLWETWIDGRISALNSELAQVLVEVEKARATLTRAFGKFQVAAHLYEQSRLAKLRATYANDI